MREVLIEWETLSTNKENRVIFEARAKELRDLLRTPEGERVMEGITKYIQEELHLAINQKKSKICGATLATFLGFNIQNLLGK